MPAGPRPTPPSRVCKVVFSGHYGGAPWVNVMWLYLTGDGEITVANLNTLAADCGVAFADRFMPFLHEFCEHQSTQVVLYSDGDAFEGIDDTITTGGEDGSDPLPANVAACVSWHIAPVYRGGHPRTYLCGIPAAYQAAVNTFTVPALTSLESRAEDFHSDIESIGPIGGGIDTVEHGVVSFVRAGAWRTPPVFYRIISSSVDQRIDTQRRRLGPDTA